MTSRMTKFEDLCTMSAAKFELAFPTGDFYIYKPLFKIRSSNSRLQHAFQLGL